MIIKKVDTIELSIPFSDGSAGEGIMPSQWTELDMVLVRIEADNGLVGWGEAFSYFCRESVAALINRAIKPVLEGATFTSPQEIQEDLQRKMILQGMYGISSFAHSGIDIALWDLWAKAEQVPVYQLLGGKTRDSIPAYASLVRYADTALVRQFSQKAINEGYRYIKLHEIALKDIEACREVAGPEIAMTVDVNCNWSEAFTREIIPALKELDTLWLEEPIFPADDFDTLASLRKTGIPIATGENFNSVYPFKQMLEKKAADYIQPSITKVGGITAFDKIRQLDWSPKAEFMPHSPYFGPGYLATLQMIAAEERCGCFEYLYVEPKEFIYDELPVPTNGDVAIPEGVGMGMEPNLDTVERYAV